MFLCYFSHLVHEVPIYIIVTKNLPIPLAKSESVSEKKYFGYKDYHIEVMDFV